MFAYMHVFASQIDVTVRVNGVCVLGWTGDLSRDAFPAFALCCTASEAPTDSCDTIGYKASQLIDE